MFRANDLNGNEVKGGWCKVAGRHLIIPLDAQLSTYKWRNSNLMQIDNPVEIDPKTLAMDTTVKDKDGKLIYGSLEYEPGEMSDGGDSLKDIECDLIYRVCFGTSEFGLGWFLKAIPARNSYRFDQSVSKLEIIGPASEGDK